MDLWNATGALALEHSWIFLLEGNGGVQRREVLRAQGKGLPINE